MFWDVIDKGSSVALICTMVYVYANYQASEIFSPRAFFAIFMICVGVSVCWWQTIALSARSMQVEFIESAALLLLFAGFYWRLASIGTVMACVGTLSNKFAMIANGGTMPVFVNPESSWSAAVIQSLRHHVASGQTHFAYLCDWITLSDRIMSVGDFLIIFGFYILSVEILFKSSKKPFERAA